MDLLGQWQHFTVPREAIDEKSAKEGLGFDGSSIRGWRAIHESDMLAVPDLGAYFIDPFAEVKTAVAICDVVDPVKNEPYERDPRFVARKAEEFLMGAGIGNKAFFGPELEFFIFDEMVAEQDMNSSFHRIDSREGDWNRGNRNDNGTKHGDMPRPKGGYFPVPPTDSLQDLRTRMLLTLMGCGVECETQHHEVATAGQAEIDMRYQTLVKMGDNVATYKYVTKNEARRDGKIVSFMAKPLFEDNGSGMHTHFSIWMDDKNLFSGDKYAGLSEMALHAIGGILKHTPALVAITNPTTNSYRRLVPGYEAPVNLAHSMRNRSAGIRIPMYSRDPRTKRIEVRFPDSMGNPYLTFAAILMAAIDGIRSGIEPGDPMDVDIYEHGNGKIQTTPGSLEEALINLERDHEFLTRDGVFTEGLLRTWIEYKRKKEIDSIRLRPHPYEFVLYAEV